MWLVLFALLFSQENMATLIVPEPTPLVTRNPNEDIRKLLRPEASIIEARNRLDRNIDERNKELTRLTKLRDEVGKDLAITQRAFDERSAALEVDRQIVRTRLALLADNEGTSALSDLLSSASFGAYEQRRAARELLAVADRERIRAYAASVAAWKAAEADLDRRKTNLARADETIANIERELVWDHEEQTALLAAVVNEPEFYAAYAQEMEKLDEVIATKVKELSAAAPADRRRMYMEETRGGLSTPIRNTDLVGGFGTRNYKGIRSVWRGAHFYPMRAPKEDERVDVRAIYWGWVAWTGWIPGLGKVVIIDHTVSFTSIYAHLASIDVTVGEKVKTGHVLGAMGDTESFFGKRLYMELRRDGVALDPLPWMR